jgi:hypothetical protein
MALFCQRDAISSPILISAIAMVAVVFDALIQMIVV